MSLAHSIAIEGIPQEEPSPTRTVCLPSTDRDLATEAYHHRYLPIPVLEWHQGIPGPERSEVMVGVGPAAIRVPTNDCLGRPTS